MIKKDFLVLPISFYDLDTNTAENILKLFRTNDEDVIKYLGYEILNSLTYKQAILLLISLSLMTEYTVSITKDQEKLETLYYNILSIYQEVFGAYNLPTSFKKYIKDTNYFNIKNPMYKVLNKDDIVVVFIDNELLVSLNYLTFVSSDKNLLPLLSAYKKKYLFYVIKYFDIVYPSITNDRLQYGMEITQIPLKLDSYISVTKTLT